MKKNIKQIIISTAMLTTLMLTLSGCGGEDEPPIDDTSVASDVEISDEIEEEVIAEEVQEEIEEEVIVAETIKGKIAQLEPELLIIDEDNQRILTASNSIDTSNIKAGDLVDVEYILSADSSNAVEIVSIITYYESSDFINAYIALFDVFASTENVGFTELSQYKTIALDIPWIDGITEMEKTAFVQILKQKLNNDSINIVFGNKSELIANGHMVVETDNQGPDRDIVPDGIHLVLDLKKSGNNYDFSTTYYFPNGSSGVANYGILNYDASSNTYSYTITNSAG